MPIGETEFVTGSGIRCVPQSIAGISGGRTSALMALKYLPNNAVLSFQNTGKEHSKTLEFLQRVEDDLQRPIVRLEFRAPPRGEPPGKATFERVSHEQLSRKGEPFMDLLLCVKTYRAKVKGLGPVAPWARQRFCTAYMKIRTQAKYIKSLGWEDPVVYVGLRADEPLRIAKMHERNDARNSDERAPLDAAGVTKNDVFKFWASKPYDLDLPEHLGNCTGCFLKDEADLATALADDEDDAEWWIGVEREFGNLRPRDRSSYAQVYAEAPARLLVREQISMGLEPAASLDPKRLKLITRQETTRFETHSGFSCHCEGAERFDDDAVLTMQGEADAS